MNPFQHLYDACNIGTNAEKHKGLADFPDIIDVELTNTCNFRCAFCPTGNLSLQRPGGFMAFETFEKIVEQCAPHGTGIRFIQWGEPLLHPQFFRFLRHAHDALLPTHLNTNGSKIDDAAAQMLISMGLDSIKFSFQGANKESYAEMRQVDFFDQLREVIRRFHMRRGSSSKPFIAVSTSITDEHPSQIEVFKRRFEPICDQLSIGHTVFDFMDLSKVRIQTDVAALARRATGKKAHPRPCPEVNNKLSIQYNGAVRTCCNDFDGVTDLGNVNDTPLAEIWKHPEMESYRERLGRDEYTGPLCSVCFDYQDLTEEKNDS